MIIAKIHVNGVQASVKECQRIPAGAVGLKLQIDYDGDAWAGLSKTVVFRGCVIKDVVDAGTEVTIPPEAIADCGNSLQVGIYGINSRGDLVIPTLWADLGRVYYAADPSGDETTEVTLPVWAQLQAEISTLKESGSGKPGEDGATFTPSVDAEGNLSWSNNKGLANPATVNIKGPQGGSASTDAVLFTKQVLTEAEQAQARANIGAQKIEETFELIESVTVGEEGLTVIERTTKPDGTIYNLSAATLLLKVYNPSVMFGTQVDFYSGNKRLAMLLENIATMSYPVETRFSSCVYHARPKAGIYEFVSAYGVHAAMMEVHYPNNAEYQTVDANNKITKIRFSFWNSTTIPVGTVLEIYGVRA